MNQTGYIAKYILLGVSIGFGTFMVLLLFLSSGRTGNNAEKAQYRNFKVESKETVAGVQSDLESNKDVAYAMEIAKNDEAERYCEERRSSSRYFPVFEINEDTNITPKIGRELSLEDCRNTIDYMYKMKDKFSLGVNEVIAGEIRLGISIIELVISIGYPDDNNHTTTANGEHLQYVYRKGGVFENSYFYFDGGNLYSYQEF